MSKKKKKEELKSYFIATTVDCSPSPRIDFVEDNPDVVDTVTKFAEDRELEGGDFIWVFPADSAMSFEVQVESDPVYSVSRCKEK